MPLKDKIMEDMKSAMKNKDQAALRAIRAIKSAILLAETSEGFSGTLTEADELKLLQKQAKQRRDSIEQFKANGREDLAQSEAEELEIIERYLPQQLSPEALEQEVRAIVAEVGAKSPADLGAVMKVASPRFAGRADGKLVNETVRLLLSGQ